MLAVRRLLILALLGACGTTQSARPTKDDWILRKRATSIQLMTEAQVPGREYQNLGEITGAACVNKLTTKVATQQAQEDLKRQAAMIEASAVLGVYCGAIDNGDNDDDDDNCRRAIRCAGVAIRFDQRPDDPVRW